MITSTVDRLYDIGQSIWLDFLDHDLLASGELDRIIREEGVRGMTSNPTIFQKAIARKGAYDDIVRAGGSENAEILLERIMTTDVRDACDRFRGVFEKTDGRDGFVSIEVSPAAARDTSRSIEDAHRLWETVNRPNLMVKIPGTREGLPAIQRCLADGININVTLLFSVKRYREVAEAYLHALEERIASGKSPRVASVASFFVSRVDGQVDKALDALPNALAGAGGALRGRIAIANAALAYADYQRIVSGERFQNLAARGARPQRLLWASTSAKDPTFADLHYADALAGKDTVDTMTPETLHAFLDHGHPEDRLPAAQKEAEEQVAALAALGIDLEAVTTKLEEEGISSFSKSFHEATACVEEKRKALGAARG